MEGNNPASAIFSPSFSAKNADLAAKEIANTSDAVKNKISETFGEESYNTSGLNREYLAKLVFNNAKKLQTLNEIIHPAVAINYSNWVLKQQEAPYVIKEAAILFESGSYKSCDKTILVTAPKELRINRVIKRDGSSRAEVEARMDNQMTDDEKIILADF